MELVRIPIKELDNVWSLIEKDIRRCLTIIQVNLPSSDYVLKTTKEGKFQIWILWDKSKPTSSRKIFWCCSYRTYQTTIR